MPETAKKLERLPHYQDEPKQGDQNCGNAFHCLSHLTIRLGEGNVVIMRLEHDPKLPLSLRKRFGAKNSQSLAS